MNAKNKYISFLADAALAGIALSIGCAVNLSVDNKYMGALLFSLGLFAIIQLKFGLYTGKAGYMVVNPPSYIIEVTLTLAGNLLGTAIGGNLLRLTRFGSAFTEKSAAIMEAKAADSPISSFVLAIFCGILMYTAVECNKRTSANGNSASALFAISAPVMVFMLSGFNHCVADMGYFFIGGCPDLSKTVPYLIYVILGNAVGCMAIPFVKKLSINE